MLLAADVDLDHLAAVTHGFVGADLEALCREAAMAFLRRFLPAIDFASGHIPADVLRRLEVVMADFDAARCEVEPSAIREVFVEVPNVGWDDVGGLDDVKRELVEAVEWPLKHAELFDEARVRPPRGILLAGAPGCGKTLKAKALASQTQVNFISVKGPALLSKYMGESERGVREVFKKAKQAAPCIVFFDEIDFLLPARGSGGVDSHVTERVIGQFLDEMDGVEDLNGVLVLAATNRPDILDEAQQRLVEDVGAATTTTTRRCCDPAGSTSASRSRAPSSPAAPRSSASAWPAARAPGTSRRTSSPRAPRGSRAPRSAPPATSPPAPRSGTRWPPAAPTAPCRRSARSPAVPARFGTIFSAEDAVVHLAALHRDRIVAFLDEVDGKAEWSLKLEFEPGRAVEYFLRNDPGLAERLRALPDSPGARFFKEKSLRCGPTCGTR
jgi:hypothetical protein